MNFAPQLCSYAQDWANTLAHTNTFRYRNNCRDVGQNIYCRLNVKDQAEVVGQLVANYWYSGCRLYDYLKEPEVLHASVNTGKLFLNFGAKYSSQHSRAQIQTTFLMICIFFSGHFTQLVWAGTCDVGIGIARSRSGKVMVVAHYRPAGNFSGGFQENVPPPLAEFSSDGSSDYSQSIFATPSLVNA